MRFHPFEIKERRIKDGKNFDKEHSGIQNSVYTFSDIRIVRSNRRMYNASLHYEVYRRNFCRNRK